MLLLLVKLERIVISTTSRQSTKALPGLNLINNSDEETLLFGITLWYFGKRAWISFKEGQKCWASQLKLFLSHSRKGLVLPHTSAFFLLLVALRHDTSGYNFYFRRCFFLHVKKLSCLWHVLSLVLLQNTEYVTYNDIIEIAPWRTVTGRNVLHEKRIRVGQP